MDPAACVGKITGMLLEMDLDEIVPLLFFPDMVRSTSPKPSTLRAQCTRPLARLRVVCCSYWIKSRKRKGCLALHTPTTTNPAHPTPIPAPSLLTISRHAPTLNPVQTILQPRVKKHHSYIPRISPILL